GGGGGGNETGGCNAVVSAGATNPLTAVWLLVLVVAVALRRRR
ncbi:MAG: MYXO-CTERM sorting domain-containing protein, partial [Planctomycetota bacterium]